MSPAKSKRYSPAQCEKRDYIVVLCEGFAEQIRKLLARYDLDGIRGAGVTINVYAEEVLDYCSVIYGDEKSEAGKVHRFKWYGSNEWETIDPSSGGYEGIPDKVEIGHGAHESEEGEKPLPPDGLWLSVRDDNPVLDSGV